MANVSGDELSRTAIARRLRAAGCVFAEREAELLVAHSEGCGDLATLVARRVAGGPLEYVLGWAEFCGLHIAVDAGVFVPRPRTEFLARSAAACAPAGAVVVDLCCGSGAVGAALAALTGAVAEVHAVDLDPAAVSCARRNLPPGFGRAYLGDLYGALPADLRGRVDLVVCNSPYVPVGRLDFLPREARLYEPQGALDGGADGLAVVRRVVGSAREWLARDGRVLLECAESQAPEVATLIARSRLVPSVLRDEDLEATVVTGLRLTGGAHDARGRAGAG